ncbi:MAG: hypothetical protein WCX31_15395 [Salinivirgaceae bacterium]|jgi:hypothetical protein
MVASSKNKKPERKISFWLCIVVGSSYFFAGSVAGVVALPSVDFAQQPGLASALLPSHFLEQSADFVLQSAFFVELQAALPSADLALQSAQVQPAAQGLLSLSTIVICNPLSAITLAAEAEIPIPAIKTKLNTNAILFMILIY